jgi:hypothetical protein
MNKIEDPKISNHSTGKSISYAHAKRVGKEKEKEQIPASSHF